MKTLPAVRSALRTLCLTLLCACGREFPPSPELQVAMEVAAWPDTLVVTDTVELTVRLLGPGGGEVSGAAVSWSSSDPSILDVVALPPPAGSTPFDSLAARLRVRAHARGTGDVQVTAVIQEGGALRRAEVTRTINVQARWISVSAGYQHSCGVTVNNDAYCWGGGLRLLGNGSSSGSVVPARVVGDLPFASVTAGWEHSCGMLLDGLMYCWGYNPYGALGNSNHVDQLAPDPVEFRPRFLSVHAGYGYTCGVSDINTAACWGDNSSGQLSTAAKDLCGTEQTRCSLVPVAVFQGSGAVFMAEKIAPGERSTCAIDLAGTAFCWGDNARGLLGTLSRDSSSAPVPIASTARFRSISVGGHHACAIATDGQAWCWGTNQFGELGSSVAGDSCDGFPCAPTPVPVSTSVRFEEISVRGRTSCARTAGGEVWCWGLNDHGQLGSASTESCSGLRCSTVPQQVDGGLTFSSISAGKAHVCGLATNGGAYCWGQRSDGALGTAGTEDAPRPQRVTSPRS